MNAQIAQGEIFCAQLKHQSQSRIGPGRRTNKMKQPIGDEQGTKKRKNNRKISDNRN